MANNRRQANSQDDSHEYDIQIKLHVARLEEAAKKKKEEEEIARHNEEEFEKVKKVKENLELFGEIKNILRDIYELTGQVITFGGHVFPPLKAVIEGFKALFEIFEIIFISKETLNRKAIRIFNAVAACVAGIFSFVLACNPASAATGMVLIASAALVASVKESIFWYKQSRDLRKAKGAYDKLIGSGSATDAEISAAKEEIARFRKSRDEARTQVINNSISCVAAVIGTVIAFAVAGALVINPIGLAFLGGVAIALTASIAIRNIKELSFFKNKKERQLEKDNQKKQKQLKVHEATESIAHRLAPQSSQAEKKFLKATLAKKVKEKDLPKHDSTPIKLSLKDKLALDEKETQANITISNDVPHHKL